MARCSQCGMKECCGSDYEDFMSRLYTALHGIVGDRPDDDEVIDAVRGMSELIHQAGGVETMRRLLELSTEGKIRLDREEPNNADKHTPETIREVSDDELNRLVTTEVMGWEWHEAFGSWQTGNGYVYPETWNPATTWDAGRVLERMRELGWYCCIEINLQGPTECVFHEMDHRKPLYASGHDDAPRAICEAACLAIQEPDDE